MSLPQPWFDAACFLHIDVQRQMRLWHQRQCCIINSVGMVKCSTDGSVPMHLPPENTMTHSWSTGPENQVGNNTQIVVQMGYLAIRRFLCG